MTPSTQFAYPSLPTVAVRSSWDQRLVHVADFAALVPTPPAGAPWWTPRNADLLFTAATGVLDDYLGYPGADGPADVVERVALDVPPCAARHIDALWVDSYLRCIGAHASQIASGTPPVSDCNGAMFAMQMILARAQEAIDIPVGSVHTYKDLDVYLPRFDSDYDMDAMHSGLLANDDVLLLFEPSLDGLENDSALASEFGIVNLHPASWFERKR